MQPDRVALYRLMLLSRLVEEAIGKLWHEGKISGEMHSGIGEEAIIAGTVSHLGDGDAMALDHRSTSPMVMRGIDPAAIIRECLGRADGLCHGMGGHMHLYSKEHLAASSGIVGAAGPAACGFALAHQHLRPNKVALAFFGEGAMNQGMLMESLNLASTWKLPVIFVCKDNGMAITTPSRQVTAGDLCERARSFDITTTSVDGADVESVWTAAANLVERARSGRGPGFLHATCSRPEGHFLGDPLLRIVRRPITELKDKVGPLLSASSSLSGSSVGERIHSLSSITGILGRAADMITCRGWDPIRRYLQRLDLDPAHRSSIEANVELEVQVAIDTATKSEKVQP
ncbi:MAG: thiamine pyrophosphate-dependent dehydrogenase E1 component subunit alpha [bacterium]|nr:thiamine pyrophosphate-dependent dehydrogenase E1 component subunit alpha [bacterium]